LSSGELFTWGEGQFGATGLGTQQNSFAPTKVEMNNSRFLQVSCGKRHTLAIDVHGGVYIAGDNQYRQLGISGINEIMQFQKLNDFSYSAKQVAAGSEHSLILTNDGRVYSAGNNSNGNLGLGHNYSSDKFLSVHGLSNLKFMLVSAGRHSAALTEDNRLFVWGPTFICEKPLVLPQELRSNK
jgi:alpha-tubulin suppressor-like RCC1 family protein